MTDLDLMLDGVERIEYRAGTLDRYRRHWLGEQPAAYLSRKSRDALDSTLSRLSVNFPRLAVTALADRLTLNGFVWSGTDEPSRQARAWADFTTAGGHDVAAMAHIDRLLYGASAVTVWGRPGPDGTGARPTVTADNPSTMYVSTDPASGDVLYAVRRVDLPDSGTAAVLYTPDTITRWERDGFAGRWEHRDTTPNALRVVPVVPMVRRVSGSDSTAGASYVADILDLTDANAKLLADAMVGSEYFARPRRWATGLEIEEDEDGNPIDPFGTDRLMQSEDPQTEFGQLDSGRLDGYGDMIATITQQIGALTGLPPHYLGLHGDQPPSSEAVRASEVQLTTRAYGEMRSLGHAWGRVAWLVDAVVRGVPADPADERWWEVDWQNPETRTTAQAADAAGKLRDIGVPLDEILRSPLGYSAADAEAIATRARLDGIVAAGRLTAGR